MIVTKQVFNQPAFEAIVRGPVVADLQRRAARVVEVSRENVARQFPPVGDFPFPARRTGDLLNSIHQATLVTSAMTAVYVIADSEHRGFEYPLHLRRQGWQFITEQQLDQAIKEE